ncbi:type II secretion system protein GspL [Arenicella xantha]|uniref:Type II secretion system protein L n=1 Tax=Arenicella xantha TaxID=644221 RepID=A0A395JI36_9GAMM|nr:type II secretion system protein GspL [Arenicella xantha]RBP49249.1 type II secretion system protein L [Arenicella xantha]
MKIYLKLEAPFEWVRMSGSQVDAFGEVPSLADYPITDDDDIVGVIASEWVTMHRVSLPAKTKKQFVTALPYALEESISEDVENVHFVYPIWKAGETCNVYTVAKYKMVEWSELATSNRLPIKQLIPEHALLPFHDAADCSLAVVGEQIVSHHKDGYGVSVDPELLDVWLMDIPVTSTVAINDEALTAKLISEHPDRDFRHWPFGYKMAHWLEYPVTVNMDLWGESYRPKVTVRGKRAFILPVALLIIGIVAKMGYDTFRYIGLHSEIRAIQSESQALLASTFPEVGPVPLGTERQVMERAIARFGGETQSKGLHSALAEVANVTARSGVTLNNIVYRNDELIITCLLNSFSQVDNLTRQFNSRPSISASLQSSASEDGEVIASYSIRQK